MNLTGNNPHSFVIPPSILHPSLPLLLTPPGPGGTPRSLKRCVVSEGAACHQYGHGTEGFDLWPSASRHDGHVVSATCGTPALTPRAAGDPQGHGVKPQPGYNHRQADPTLKQNLSDPSTPRKNLKTPLGPTTHSST
ncbi:unnamed protein product [Pleuronectes platessa]|uniref:Uncharacterized protein n=1 Tax=Pleuronectes platessa TaxID=8262 RepID=A0A9N7V876_PLEPL|nr:unnamed protein product [Pleuronectes platessa]